MDCLGSHLWIQSPSRFFPLTPDIFYIFNLVLDFVFFNKSFILYSYFSSCPLLLLLLLIIEMSFIKLEALNSRQCRLWVFFWVTECTFTGGGNYTVPLFIRHRKTWYSCILVSPETVILKYRRAPNISRVCCHSPQSWKLVLCTGLPNLEPIRFTSGNPLLFDLVPPTSIYYTVSVKRDPSGQGQLTISRDVWPASSICLFTGAKSLLFRCTWNYIVAIQFALKRCH